MNPFRESVTGLWTGRQQKTQGIKRKCLGSVDGGKSEVVERGRGRSTGGREVFVD